MFEPMTSTITLEQVEAAHKASEECSARYQALVQQVIDNGKPTLELVEQVEETNRECDRLVEEYLAVYRAYQSQQ
jgi:uncharacterized coiled-coil DUF342 family protein